MADVLKQRLNNRLGNLNVRNSRATDGASALSSFRTLSRGVELVNGLSLKETLDLAFECGGYNVPVRSCAIFKLILPAPVPSEAQTEAEAWEDYLESFSDEALYNMAFITAYVKFVETINA